MCGRSQRYEYRSRLEAVARRERKDRGAQGSGSARIGQRKDRGSARSSSGFIEPAVRRTKPPLATTGPPLPPQDFGASGLRTGVYYSRNTEAVAALQQLGYFTCVSGNTQRILATMLEDRAWVQAYLQRNRKVVWTLGNNPPARAGRTRANAWSLPCRNA